MRTIRRSRRFKSDYKREKRGRFSKILDDDLERILYVLAADGTLPEKCRDHPLIGQWNDHRDCHIYHDLVLIYRKPDLDRLDLIRLGSHSELGL